MKTSTRITAAVAFYLVVTLAQAEQIWVAQPTAIKQCDPERNAGLGEAVSELERNKIVVQGAVVAKLRDRLTCMACGQCLEGSYNIVQIEESPQSDNVLRQGSWERIDPKDIRVVSGPSF